MCWLFSMFLFSCTTVSVCLSVVFFLSLCVCVLWVEGSGAAWWKLFAVVGSFPERRHGAGLCSCRSSWSLLRQPGTIGRSSLINQPFASRSSLVEGAVEPELLRHLWCSTCWLLTLGVFFSSFLWYRFQRWGTLLFSIFSLASPSLLHPLHQSQQA